MRGPEGLVICLGDVVHPAGRARTAAGTSGGVQAASVSGPRWARAVRRVRWRRSTG